MEVGIAALVGVLACTIGALIVLISSNGKITDTWSYGHQPSLYLSVLSIVSNILMAPGLSQALCITFWRKALIGGSLRDLHDYWRNSNSILGALRSVFEGRAKRNALVCIVIALSVIRAPLNQKATIVQGNVIFPRNGAMELHIAQELPSGYAGVTEHLRGWTTETGMLTPDFIKVMNSYSQRTQLTLQNLAKGNTFNQCNGTCPFIVKAFGFKPVCQITIIEGFLYINSDSEVFNNGFSTDGILLFPSGQEEYFGANATATLGLNATFFANENDSNFTNHLCNVEGGVLSYPITISEGALTLDLNALGENGDFDDIQPVPLLKPITSDIPLNTIIRGFQFAAHYLFNSSADYFYGGAVGTWQLSGPLANQYLVTSDGAITSGFRDPMADMISTIQQIAFRAALQAAAVNSTLKNSTQIAEYRGTQENLIYVTRYQYMISAAILSLVGILAMIPLFWGWWLLGREFCMSPSEIARAFDAPLLRGADGNSSAEKLAKGFKGVTVQYGSSAKGLTEDQAKLLID